jgi:2-polyprenyl-3-methyl-5-hydroxy-6-metoxy-1,4-benzoquinol methylase
MVIQPGLLDSVVARIEALDPLHGKKTRQWIESNDAAFRRRAEDFLAQVDEFLRGSGHDLSFGVDCYLRWIRDIRAEMVDFMRTGEYSCKSFAEVNRRVYADPGVMEAHTIGLLLSRLLLKHNYQPLEFFVSLLPPMAGRVESFLEIGAGHGLFIAEARKAFAETASYDVLDISESAIGVARRLIQAPEVHFIVGDVLAWDAPRRYDFIAMAEVIEHLEDPLPLMRRVRGLLAPHGVLFLTTPTNAPAIDHIYLFHNASEIRSLIAEAGYAIVEEACFAAANVLPERAEELKITTIYCGLLRSRA